MDRQVFIERLTALCAEADVSIVDSGKNLVGTIPARNSDEVNYWLLVWPDSMLEMVERIEMVGPIVGAKDDQGTL